MPTMNIQIMYCTMHCMYYDYYKLYYDCIIKIIILLRIVLCIILIYYEYQFNYCKILHANGRYRRNGDRRHLRNDVYKL